MSTSKLQAVAEQRRRDARLTLIRAIWHGAEPERLVDLAEAAGIDLATVERMVERVPTARKQRALAATAGEREAAFEAAVAACDKVVNANRPKIERLREQNAAAQHAVEQARHALEQANNAEHSLRELCNHWGITLEDLPEDEDAPEASKGSKA